MIRSRIYKIFKISKIRSVLVHQIPRGLPQRCPVRQRPNPENPGNRDNPAPDFHDYHGPACQDDQVSLIVPLP